MWNNTKFLSLLAVGVVLFLLPSTLEMERRSHALSSAVRRAHIAAHPDQQQQQQQQQQQAPPPAPQDEVAANPPQPAEGRLSPPPIAVQQNSAANSPAQQTPPPAAAPNKEVTLEELERYAAEQEAAAAAAAEALKKKRAEVASQLSETVEDALKKPARQGAVDVGEEGEQQEDGEEAESAGEEGGGGQQKSHRKARSRGGASKTSSGGASHASHAGQPQPRHHGHADNGPDGLGALPGTPTCKECSHHGICQHDESGAFKGCLCAVLYNGAADCSKITQFPKPRPMTGFQGRYDKSLIIAKSNVKGRSELLAIRDPTARSKSMRALAPVAKVNSKLLHSLPDEDPTDGRVYETCAIVGSSGILLNYKRGAEIDSHDMVFRFNSAPTKGFEEFCGRKTTHRITNSRNFAYREYASEIDMQHMRSPNNIEALIEQRRRHPKKRFYGIHTDFINYMDDSLDFLATSGLFGIFIALHKCASIDIYGFQVHARHGVQYHYYNPKDKPANEGRDDTEFEVIKALAEAGLFKFSEACVLECHQSKEVCDKCKAKERERAGAV